MDIPGWRFVHIGTENDGFLLEGIDPWKSSWHHQQLPPIVVPHPVYPQQRHKMWISELRPGARVIRFAAGEFSNGVWGFYVPSSIQASASEREGRDGPGEG